MPIDYRHTMPYLPRTKGCFFAMFVHMIFSHGGVWMSSDCR